MRAVWKTQTGVKNQENQDRALVDSGMSYFILADGVGGEAGGGVASSIAIEIVSQTLASRISEVRGSSELQSLISEAINLANAEIKHLSTGKLSRMASTIAVAAVNGSDIVLANVGDTRVYAVFRGHLSVVSHDHNAAMELVQHRLLKSDQLRGHPFRNIITRSLGHAQHVEPFVNRLSTNDVSLLLLCTDGIWSVLEDSALEYIMTHTVSLEEKCTQILDTAFRMGSTDDLTCVLVDTSHLGHM
jgi:protein phosphatase